MSDEFFAKIDKTMGDRAEKAAAAEVATAAAAPAVADAITQCADLAQDYSAKLTSRGITLTVETGSGWVAMKMRYQDGGHRNLSYGASADRRPPTARGYDRLYER